MSLHGARAEVDIDHPPEEEDTPALLRVDAFLDIETEDWETFVLGGLLDVASGDYRSTREEDELVEWLLTRGGHVWTWNGGHFDTLWLMHKLRATGLRFTWAQAGPRVTRLDCEGLVVRDAVALIPMSLAKAAKMAGIELAKVTGLPCRRSCPERKRFKKPCAGYCSIRRSMSEAEFALLDKYLRLDCEAGAAALAALIREAERCEYELAGTVGGTSYKNFSKLAELEPASWPDAATYYLARSGYYGGRTEVFRPLAERGFAYDINSAYPAALSQVALPCGDMRKLLGMKAESAFVRDLEGIYVARVHVPEELFLPPLPKRTPGGRLVYPVGVFEGAWTALELRAAIERGCAADIDSALVWSDAEPVMASALLLGWENRARAKSEGNDSMHAWHKWHCNSFTGKLAEDPDKERGICNPTDDEVKLCTCGPRAVDARGCRCGAWRPLDKSGALWGAPFWRLSACAHVHWAAYLTAWTRVTLLGQMEDDGEGGRSMVYSDTDSVKAVSPRTEGIGEELGEFKDEGEWERWASPAPKVYRYWDPAKKEWVVRGKGLPGLTADEFDRFAAGEPVVVERGVMSLRQAASKGGKLFARRRLERRSHADGLHFGGRVLRGVLTFPRPYPDIVAWEKESR